MACRLSWAKAARWSPVAKGRMFGSDAVMARPDVRLAILDEPARGLDREARRSLLARARQHFARATMIFVTHDVPDTLDFQRVLVVEHGRIIEQGLAARVVREDRFPVPRFVRSGDDHSPAVMVRIDVGGT